MINKGTEYYIYGDNDRPAKVDVKEVGDDFNISVSIFDGKSLNKSDVNLADFFQRSRKIEESEFKKLLEG